MIKKHPQQKGKSFQTQMATPNASNLRMMQEKNNANSSRYENLKSEQEASAVLEFDENHNGVPLTIQLHHSGELMNSEHDENNVFLPNLNKITVGRDAETNSTFLISKASEHKMVRGSQMPPRHRSLQTDRERNESSQLQ